MGIHFACWGGVEVADQDHRTSRSILFRMGNDQRRAIEFCQFAHMVQMGVVKVKDFSGDFIFEFCPDRQTRFRAVPAPRARNFRGFREHENALIQQFKAVRPVEDGISSAPVFKRLVIAIDPGITGHGFDVIGMHFPERLLNTKEIELVVFDNFTDTGLTAFLIVRRRIGRSPDVEGSDTQDG